MPTYQAIYKCRLCGKKINSESLEENTALDFVAMVNSPKDNFYHSSELFRYAMHKCKDGSYGFADFLGFRKKKEPGE